MISTATSMEAREESGLGQHLLVAVVACALTVSVAGSGLYFVVRWVDRDREAARMREFVDSLDHRSAKELGETVALLRQRPALAARMLPVVVRRMRRSASAAEPSLGALRVAAAFAGEEPKVAEALFEIRRVGNESVATEAVAALGTVRPMSRAAELLGNCIEEGASAAVADVACAQLIELGSAGRAALAGRLGKLSADRRWWLVGLIEARRPTQAREWLGLLAADKSPEVRERAREAMKAMEGSRRTEARRHAGT